MVFCKWYPPIICSAWCVVSKWSIWQVMHIQYITGVGALVGARVGSCTRGFQRSHIHSSSHVHWTRPEHCFRCEENVHTLQTLACKASWQAFLQDCPWPHQALLPGKQSSHLRRFWSSWEWTTDNIAGDSDPSFCRMIQCQYMQVFILQCLWSTTSPLFTKLLVAWGIVLIRPLPYGPWWP